MTAGRTRKHAVVVVLPLGSAPNEGALARERFMKAFQRTMTEYIWTARWMRTDDGTTDKKTPPSVDASPRLMLSLNLLTGDETLPEIARPVIISGQGATGPAQLGKYVETRIQHWARHAMQITEQMRRISFLALLEALAKSRYDVSVIAPADSLPVGLWSETQDDTLSHRLTECTKTASSLQFVLLRDDEEQADAATRNVVMLLRSIKQSGNVNCTIRSVEDHAVDLQGILKEWLYISSPHVTTMIEFSQATTSSAATIPFAPVVLELRANFVLLCGDDAMHMSRWTALHQNLSHLQFLHFVPLPSVHPSVLVGCPLEARLLQDSLSSDEPHEQRNTLRARAFVRFLEDKQFGGVVRCRRETKTEFYLVTSSHTKQQARLLVFRMASAEEILLPPNGENIDGNNEDATGTDATTDSVRQQLSTMPCQAYNPFQYRSFVTQTAQPLVTGKRPRQATSNPTNRLKSPIARQTTKAVQAKPSKSMQKAKRQRKRKVNE